MYPGYIRACDIVSFDIYPVTDADPSVSGNLWYVPKGIDSLRMWSGYQKPAWCWIECTDIHQSGIMPTPAQVKSEVWMALIHEASGFGYYCHEGDNVISAWLTKYPTMKAAITAINLEVTQLAPVLNSPTVRNMVTIKPANFRAKPVSLVKVQGGYTYVFAVNEKSTACQDTFTINGLPSSATATVLSESRSVPIVNGKFVDSLAGYGLHLYRIDAPLEVRIDRAFWQRKLERTVELFPNPCAGDQVVIRKHIDLRGEPVAMGIYNRW
jgi:hypothetical protein